ncbi:hypothetical protein SLUN_00565 [Streptomyces lunaelactis]|uniref:Peptidoglycan binding-like domain-containing protein n=1 Tax=Streptomyces lunaelactis TaxID=1535768 RepID=A0A2R4SVU4_9ACTN|nr:peptidoglycan-binding domain-containing protein [Streptomyces lunaelactis]AVZ70978.1 hypothetical protein SLUN_00565 [Streptomyces lunaelactis]NUK24713.1 peptidoglycan-binding protein [Streptomyces lunaelactis]NUK85967.1 peptidoglycan-binding protein [Streptomyces lunaelactis]
MSHSRRITASCATFVLAAASLLATAPAAEASPGICYLTSYDNPYIPGREQYVVPEYDLRYGMNDYCVAGLQRQINRRYGNPLTVDGIYGPRTRDWVKRIQRDFSWCAGGVDGVAGRNTISCFEHVTGWSEF